MFQRLPASLRAIEHRLELNDLDGQWRLSADLTKDHVSHLLDQIGMARDFRAKLIPVDATRKLGFGRDKRPRRWRALGVEHARLAPKAKGADLSQPDEFTLVTSNPRMGPVLRRCLRGEERQ